MQAYNAEGDIRLYIITMRSMDLGDGRFGIMHRVELAPASR